MKKELLDIDIKVRISSKTDKKLKEVCAEQGIKRASLIRALILKELEEKGKDNGELEDY